MLHVVRLAFEDFHFENYTIIYRNHKVETVKGMNVYFGSFPSHFFLVVTLVIKFN